MISKPYSNIVPDFWPVLHFSPLSLIHLTCWLENCDSSLESTKLWLLLESTNDTPEFPFNCLETAYFVGLWYIWWIAKKFEGVCTRIWLLFDRFSLLFIYESIKTNFLHWWPWVNGSSQLKQSPLSHLSSISVLVNFTNLVHYWGERSFLLLFMGIWQLQMKGLSLAYINLRYTHNNI